MTFTVDTSICAKHGAYGGPTCPMCSLPGGLYIGRGSGVRLRCGRCGHQRDHVVGEPLPPCPGACGATENSAVAHPPAAKEAR